jgi:hypothetical protein
LNIHFVLRVLEFLSWVSFGLTFWRWVASARFPLHHRAAAAPPPLPVCTVL